MSNKFFVFISLITLSGFGTVEPLLISSIGANWLLNEQRPLSVVLEDMKITHNLNRQLNEDTQFFQTANVTPISYNQMVILTGQVPNAMLKQQAFYYATHTPNVKRVFNQLLITPPTTPWQRIQDTLLHKLIQAKLLTTSNLRFHHFITTVENRSVFIIGKATPEEAALATRVAQHTVGIKMVIKAIEPI